MKHLAKRLNSFFLNDYFILGLIILNATVIFIQGFDMHPLFEQSLTYLDHFITLLFFTEMLVKIKSWGLKNYLNSSWNIFDAVLVGLALPSLLFWISNIQMGLEFLLVLRILRVFKFFRFLRFVPNIAALINGVKRALKTSVVVLFGFFVFIFIVSVISCFFYKDVSPDFFGDPLKALYSTFKVFTIEGWYEIPDTLAENLSQTKGFFTKLFFVAVLISGGIFGLSIVNSIFVDAMVSDNNDDLEAKVSQLETKIDHLTKILENKRDNP